MTVRRTKKHRKFRGRRPQGYGRISGGHRKGGQRGGKGKAGSTGHHKIIYQQEMLEAGKGFTPISKKKKRTINVGELDQLIFALETTGKIKKVNDAYEIDLNKLVYDKLLGKGSVTHKLNVKGKEATPTAIKKLESSGGSFSEE